MLFYPEAGLPSLRRKPVWRIVRSAVAADGTRLMPGGCRRRRASPSKVRCCICMATAAICLASGGQLVVAGAGLSSADAGLSRLRLVRGQPARQRLSGRGCRLQWLAKAPAVQGKPLLVLGQSIGGALGDAYWLKHTQQRRKLKATDSDGPPPAIVTWPLHPRYVLADLAAADAAVVADTDATAPSTACQTVRHADADFPEHGHTLVPWPTASACTRPRHCPGCCN